MNGFHRTIALGKLKCLRNKIDYLITCLEQGEIYNICINGNLVDLLFETRDEILMSNLEEE